MKGIVLAGGYATRLFPITISMTKQLLPVYDKPMIYYPLSLLMLKGIKEILIIVNSEYLENFKRLLDNGDRFGVKFYYKIQEKPRGLADAFILGEDFIQSSNVMLVLGDNILYGAKLKEILKNISLFNEGGIIFSYPVKDPSKYGIVEVDNQNKILGIEEKPFYPKSNLAVIGLYYYDNKVINIAKNLKKSVRGELEITDINKIYLEKNLLKLVKFDNSFFWFDTGSYDRLFEATNFVKNIQNSQNLQVACLEEIAYKNKWIDRDNLLFSAKKFDKTFYGKYLLKLANSYE